MRPKYVRNTDSAISKEIFLGVILIGLLAASMYLGPELTGKVTESGVWISIEDVSYMNGSALFSNTADSTLTYEVNGNVTVVFQTRDDFGIVEVIENNIVIDTVDLYSSSVQYGVSKTYSVSGEFVLLVTGTSNPLSSGYYVVVDEVYGDIVEGTDQVPNVTTANVTDGITETDTQGFAEIGKPVSWTKHVKIDKEKIKDAKVKVQLPESASSITSGNKIKQTNKEIELDLENNVSDYYIEYQTEAPIAHEQLISANKKQVTISSETHYTNILAIIQLPHEIPTSQNHQIKLYHLVGGSRELFTGDISYNDTDSNGMTDTISWIVPHLSNETYEIDIQVLDVYSYLHDGDNWTVRFTTSGASNLRIHPTNAEYGNELDFLELRCDNELLAPEYNTTHIIYSNYSCDNEIGSVLHRVSIAGYVTLMFEFGDSIAYAYDPILVENVTSWASYGTYNYTHLTPTNISLEDNDSLQELPNNKVSDGYVNMTGNVLLMHFNNNALDSSGTGNNGAPNGTVSNTTGKLSGGYYFDGFNGVVIVQNHTSLVSTAGITLSSWIYLNSNWSISASVFHKDSGYAVFIYANRSISWADAGTWSFASFGNYPIVPVGEWVNIVATKNLATNIVTIYINGNLIVSKVFGGALGSANNLGIGCYLQLNGKSCANRFNGRIDEVAIWNRSLSASEIINIYNRQKSTYINQGYYESRIFESSTTSQWSNLTIIAGSQYYSQDLPSNQAVETGDLGADMTGNVGLWHFNDNPLDSSGTGNDGAVISKSVVNVTGKINDGYNFPGNESSVSVQHDQSLSLTDFTMSGWTKINDNTMGQLVKNYDYAIFSKMNGTNGYEMGVSSDNKPYISVYDMGITNWTKHNNSIPPASDSVSYNGMIPLGGAGKGDLTHVAYPTVIKEGSTYKMWYSGHNAHYRIYGGHNAYYRIYMATSPDGLTWTKVNNTIPAISDSISYNGRVAVGNAGKGDSTYAFGPNVIKDGSTYKMWYTGQNGSNYRIYMATSPDGLTWTKVNNTIPDASDSVSYNGRIPLGNAGKADSLHAYYPNVIKDGSTYRMWYVGMNTSLNTTILYATSPDGLTWTKYDNTAGAKSDYIGTNGRIPVGTVNAGDTTGIQGITVIKDGNMYKAFYVGARATIFSLYYAYSYDGLTWYKLNNTPPTESDSVGTMGRLSDGSAGKSDATYVAAPFIIKEGSVYRMWYMAWSGTNARISYAYMNTSTDSPTAIESNTWHHITATKSSGTVKLYVDGQLVSSAVSEIGNINNDNNLTFGNLLNGTLDEVAIWNRSLSATEVMNLYKRGALKLNITARSCNDSLCAGDSYTVSTTNTTFLNLKSLANNTYFQYKAYFEGDGNFTPEISKVTIGYDYLFSLQSQTNYTNDRITYTMSAQSALTETCTLYGNWSGTWAKNETKQVSSGALFNFTAITFIGNNANYLWSINCSSGNNLEWSNNISFTVGDNIGPSVYNQVNFTNNRLTYTFSATSSETSACTLYGNFSGTWAKNETKAATANTAFNFTSITFVLSNKNYLWGVNCSDSSQNKGWSVNTTFTTIDFIAPNISIINITDLTGAGINSGNFAETDENATLYINVSSDTPIDRVWIIVWQTIASAGNILWQGFLSLLSGTNLEGIWSVQIPVNESFPRATNYTVYANDTAGNIVNISGNFTVNHNPSVANVNITPYTLYTNNYPSAMWNYSDVDGDAQNKSVYTWYINGTEAWRDNSLVAYYKFDDNALDSAGANHGSTTLNLTNATGKIKDSYYFTGGSYVDLSTKLSATGTGIQNYSLDFWFNPKTLTGTQTIVDCPSWWGNAVYLTGSQLVFVRYPTALITATCAIGASLNSWNHATATFDSQQGMKIYLNGVLCGSNSNTSSINSGYYLRYIGKRQDNNNYFNGSIDEVKIWNKTLSPQEIKQEYEMMDYGQIENSPVSLWHFDENQGSIVKDAIGKNDGTRTNHANWTNASKWNSALSFDGINDYVSVPYTTSLAPTNTLSVGAWFNSRNLNSNTRIISKTETGGYQISLNENTVCTSNSLCMAAYISGSYRQASYPISNLYNNTWYQVIGVYNGSSLNLYLNGVLVKNTTGLSGSISYANSNSFCIGSEPFTSLCNAGNYFTGNIDEVFLYDRAISPQEISNLYNLSRPLYSLDESVINKGTTVKVQIEPNDDKQFGIALNSTTLTVQDTTPTANNVTIKPSSINNTVTSIAGTWDYADADGEPENASVYEWYINGTNTWRESSLVGYWKLDSNEVDSTIYNSAGTIYGNVDNITGRIRGGYYFDGNGDYVNISANNGSALDIRINKITQAAWIYPTDNASSGDGRATIATRNGNYYLQRLNTGYLSVYQYGTSPAGYHDSNLTIPLNQWSFVAYTYNGNKLEMYINGAPAGIVSKTGSISPATPAYASYPFRIGSDDGSSRFFKGIIDEVMIWNRTLSAEEISDLYNMTFYGQIDQSGANHTIPNITLDHYQSAGTNITFSVIPYNGLVYGNQTNSTTIMVYDVTKPNLTFINLTDLTGQLISPTNPAELGQNATLYINLTSDTPIDRVWVIIWTTISEGINRIWQGFLALLSGTIWSVQIPVNESFGRITNFTIYANDTWGNTVNLSGNFTTNQPPYYSNNITNFTSIGFLQTGIFNLTWNDREQLSGYIFSTNASGAWRNNSWTRLTGTVNVSSTAYQINISQYNTIGWRYYANDSDNVWNASNIYTFVTIDSVEPSIAFVAPTPTNATITASYSVEINVSVTEANLTKLIYNWNGTNYEIYNSSVMLMLDFNNLASLGENASLVKDFSINNNTARLYGNAVINTSGKYSSAIQFDGVTGYAELTDNASLNPGSNQFSIELWFMPQANGSANNNILYNKENLYEASAGGGYFTYAWQPSWSWYGSTSFPINLNEWYHAVIVYNGTYQLVYKNGVLVFSRSQTGSVGASTTALRLGARGSPAGPSAFFNGKIDGFRIYNRSLSTNEIMQNYIIDFHKEPSLNWVMYVNQSTAASSQYTYQATAYDQASNINSTGLRYLTVDNTGPIISNQINYTNDRLTYTFSAQSSETSTCTLYGNWTGTWSKNETKAATANTAFNFTSIRFMGESATYKWAVNCSDIYQNSRWSENTTFTTATGNGNLKLKSISYTPGSPNNTNEVIFNITLENDEVYNFVNVNITLGIGDSLFSNITNISTNGQNSLLFRWTAIAGTWPVEATIDINNLIAESNESDNLLSSSITVNRRVAVTITYPMNGSIISRGDGVAGEDPNGIVSTNMTIIARVYDYDNTSYPVQANCTAYINTTKLDTIYTNALGVCEINWSKVGKTLGMYDLNVNFTNLPNAHVNAPENSTAINKFRLSRYYTVLEFANDRNGQYYVGDLAILYINITKDGLLYNVTNLTSTPKASDMPNPPLQTHYIEGLTQIGTGQYIDTYIVTAMPYLFWEVEIDDILSAVQPDIAVVGSAVHSDAQINNADAELNLTIYNGTGQAKYNSMIKLYDRNKYLLDSYMINASNPFQTQKVVRGDKYSLLFTENKSSLYLKELNVTVNYTIAPQFTISNSMPNQAKQLSQVIALDSGYNFTEANLTIPFDGVTIDKICYCSAWVTQTSSCTGNAWTCNNKENYNYGNNATHFWFKVNSFSAYAGADIFGPNLDIWDQHDAGMPNATTKYANQLIGFFANYTNNETGALIPSASCNISFADINGIMKESVSSYWYNRTFSVSGTYAYNVTCHKPGLAQLLASDSIIIALSPAPKVNSVRNYTNNRITYIFTANTNETGSCTLYGNWSSSWSKNETKSATANTPFNFTAITFRHDNKNYLWGVNCSYTSSNVGWSTNTTFTVLPNTQPTKPVLVSPDNNTVTASNTTTFIWQNVTDGNNDRVSFTLQIDDNNDFSSIYFQNATYRLNYTLSLAESLPEGIWYWRILSNDTYDTNASDARILEINPSQSVSASLSNNLSGAGVVWTVNSVPQSYLNADANNGILITNYNVTISASGTTADLYIRASGNLTYSTTYIDLNNEMLSFSISNNTVSNASKKSLTTAYINNPIGSNLADGTIVYLKFYLNVSASQAPGTYRNNITFKVVPNGYTP